MLFNPKIQSFAQLAKNIFGHIEKARGGLSYDKNELLVVNYHSTPKKFMADFKKQVEFLSNQFTIIAPAELESYFNGTLRSAKCNLLFTFDDGLTNNLNAVKILDDYKIKALFFIVPDFINCTAADQKKFYLKNIRSEVNAAIDNEEEDFTAMDWDTLKKLCADGHAVGAHTLSHTLVAKNSSAHNSEKEIVACKKEIEKEMNLALPYFCSINNTLESTGKKEKELIEKNYSFHFTTLPGYNGKDKNRLFIKRRNIECFWPAGSFYFALGKTDLKRWEEKIKQYTSL